MAWTDPSGHIYAVGEIVTAATLNTYVESNLAWLGQLPATALVPGGQGTASTTYVDLATVGPAVTVTTGTNVFVDLYANISNSSANGVSYMSFAVTGATTTAASDSTALALSSAVANAGFQGSAHFLYGLTAGSNTFTCKYRATIGTGTFAIRALTVKTLP